MDKAVLCSVDGHSRVEVFLLGATLTSWVCAGEERIFLSPNAVFNVGKPIRGGIPIVFPQFGQPNTAMAQHGFARTSLWSWECGCAQAEPGSGVLILRLGSSAETLALWPHAFSLTYTVTLTATSLKCEFSVENPASASDAFKCQALLHTYIRLPSRDITRLTARGFQARHFIDKMVAGETFQDEREEANVDREVDRIYLGQAAQPFPDIELREVGQTFLVVAQSARRGSDAIPIDIVFWNAWINKSRAIPDLGEDQYKGYVCVEPGLVAEGVRVDPGCVVSIDTTLTAVSR